MALSYNTTIGANLNYVYTDDGGVFSGNLVASSTFDYFPDSVAVNDAVYFGRANRRFRTIRLFVGTSFAATSVTFAWEYHNGSAWVALSGVGNGNAMTLAGQQDVTFDMPTDWSMSKVNNISFVFWIRCRIAAVNTPTEGGAQSTQVIQAGDNVLTVTGVTSLSGIYADNVAAGYGVIRCTEIPISDSIGLSAYRYDFFAYVDFADTASISESCPMVGFWDQMEISSGASIQFGTLNANGQGFGGGRVDIGSGFNATGIYVKNGGILKLYGSQIVSWLYGNSAYLSVWGTLEIIDAISQGGIATFGRVFFGPGCTVTVRRCALSGNTWGSDFTIQAPASLTIEDMQTDAALFYIQNTALITVERIDAPALTFALYGTPWDGYGYLIDCNFDTVTLQATGTGAANVYLQYYYNLKVVNAAGVGIPGITVVIEDVDGVEIFNGVTDGNGDIAQQTLNYKIYTRPGGGSTTVVTKTPHTVTISGLGYGTRATQYTMDRAREEIEMLETQDVTAPTFAGLASATDRETGGEVALAWAAATDSETGVESYHIYYHTVNNAAQIIAQGIRQQAPAGATGAIVGGLTNDTPYYFIVRAEDAEAPPNEDTNVVIKAATPTLYKDETAPTFAGLASATDLGTGGEVELAWAAASDAETGVESYNVYYSTAPATVWSGGVRLKAGAGATGVTVGGLTNGTAYYFGVRAQDAENPANEDANAVVKSATPTATAWVGMMGPPVHQLDNEFSFQLDEELTLILDGELIYEMDEEPAHELEEEPAYEVG